MITVTAPLWIWTGENGSWHFITVPEEESDEIRAHCFSVARGFRSARVSATIKSVSWRTSVFPIKSGGLHPAGEAPKSAARRRSPLVTR